MKNYPFLLALLALASCTSKVKETATTAEWSPEGKKLQVYTTADSSSLRLSSSDSFQFRDMAQPLETQVMVFVDPDKTFQTYMGIGGAITDAAAETFYKLPVDKQKELLTAYYDPKNGIGYTVARTNMNSCDFSSDMYTYIKDGDSSLSSFNIDHDRKFKLPMIKAAMETTGGKLNLFTSPWSPPAWMKDNNDMLHGGKLKPEFYQSWANYYVKFIRAYEKEGVSVWGLSIQNEPMATQRWESCIYTAEEERDFLKKNLGPTLKKEGLGDKKIIVWDHNRDLLYQRAATYFKDPDAAQYIWGLGFHWYEDWSGGLPMYDNVKRVQEAWPDKNIFFTEGCAESFDSTRYNAWSLGEEYGSSMIHDFNNGMVGFTDWNVLLDETGGPNHVGNFCFAPVHADTRTGKIIYTNSYYYIGHFSKFIQPGAKRITVSPSRSQLIATGFRNPDGTLAIVVMNQTGKDIPYYLWINGKAAAVNAKAHSISTLVL
jgi:glucosylceramidase